MVAERTYVVHSGWRCCVSSVFHCVTGLRVHSATLLTALIHGYYDLVLALVVIVEAVLCRHIVYHLVQKSEYKLLSSSIYVIQSSF